MKWYLLDVATSMFQIYTIMSFYYRRLERRMPIYAVLLFSLGCIVGQYGLRHLAITAAWTVLASVAMCLLATVPFVAAWKYRLFYPLMITALGIVAEMTTGLLLSILCRVPVADITASAYRAEYLVAGIAAKLMFFIFIRILCRLHVLHDSTLPLRQWLLIMAVPVTSIAVCFGLASSADSIVLRSPAAAILILSGVLGINALAFFMYDELSAQSTALVEQERAQNRMESDLRRYEAMIEQSKEFAALLHDTRKHYAVLHDLLASNQHQSAAEYIARLHTAEKFAVAGTSTNAAVSALLRRKVAEACEYGIEVNYVFDVENLLPIDEVSLCLILGNALDNAIEACRALPTEATRTIDIQVHYQRERHLIRIANSSPKVEIVGNKCKTKKDNKMLHGYGLKNIQRAVESNGGNMVIRYENGMFILSIMFLL